MVDAEQRATAVRKNMERLRALREAKEAQERVFGIFQRVSQSYEGTGIGLSIVKKAIERMGGRVGVESTEGRGSTFWIEVKKAL